MCVCVCVGDFLLWINATTMQWKWILIFFFPPFSRILLLQNCCCCCYCCCSEILLFFRNHQKSIFFSFFSLSRNFFFSFFWNLLQKSSFFWASCFIRNSVRFWGMMGCMQPQCNGMKPELLPLRNSSSSSSDISFRSPSSFSEPQLGFEEWLDKSLQLALLQTICVWWRWGHLD
jgi:hypothetical protein